MSSTSVNAHMDASDRGLSRAFKSTGVIANGLTGIKKRASEEASLHFICKLRMNTLAF
jgi:hypothetical protein